MTSTILPVLASVPSIEWVKVASDENKYADHWNRLYSVAMHILKYRSDIEDFKTMHEFLTEASKTTDIPNTLDFPFADTVMFRYMFAGPNNKGNIKLEATTVAYNDAFNHLSMVLVTLFPTSDPFGPLVKMMRNMKRYQALDLKVLQINAALLIMRFLPSTLIQSVLNEAGITSQDQWNEIVYQLHERLEKSLRDVNFEDATKLADAVNSKLIWAKSGDLDTAWEFPESTDIVADFPIDVVNDSKNTNKRGNTAPWGGSLAILHVAIALDALCFERASDYIIASLPRSAIEVLYKDSVKIKACSRPIRAIHEDDAIGQQMSILVASWASKWWSLKFPNIYEGTFDFSCSQCYPRVQGSLVKKVSDPMDEDEDEDED